MTYEDQLVELAQEDPRTIVLTAENRAIIRNIPSRLPDQFLDTGITEQTMIGMSAGLALRGRRPVAHALATFLTLRAYEFIRTDIGISGLPVKLIGFVPGLLSEANGPTHQAIEDISVLRSIPNMQIFCPSDEADLLMSLKTILKSDQPAYLRYNQRRALVDHETPFEIGKAEVFEIGYDVTLLTYGTLFNEAYETREILREKGLSCGLINLRSLQPIDEEVLVSATRKSRLIVTIEDHFLKGGLYTILSEVCLRNSIAPHVLPIALNDKWFRPGLLNDVLYAEGFTPEKMSETIVQELNQ